VGLLHYHMGSALPLHPIYAFASDEVATLIESRHAKEPGLGGSCDGSLVGPDPGACADKGA